MPDDKSAEIDRLAEQYVARLVAGWERQQLPPQVLGGHLIMAAGLILSGLGMDRDAVARTFREMADLCASGGDPSTFGTKH